MVLYTSYCKNCDVLKLILDRKNVIYDVCDDVDLMVSKNFVSLPKLELDDGQVLDFIQAINWVQREVK